MNQETLLSAEDKVKPYLGAFKQCYERAIVKYTAVRDAYTEPLYERTKAIIFQNIIINEIKSEFNEENSQVKIVENYESIQLLIDNCISARFKKFNKKGFPSNHKSGRNNAIIAQQLTLGFYDYPPIAFIDVGYRMDATGTQFELLKVICRKNKDILWNLFFLDIDTGEGTNLNIEKPTPAPDVTPSRVTVNEELKKKKKKAE